MKKTALMLLVSLLISCGQWRVTSLEPDIILNIPNGSGPGEAFIKSDEFALKSMSTRVSYHNGKILLSDNELGRLQVLNTDGDVKLIIGSPENIDTENNNFSQFNFGEIGAVFMDRAGTLYIQNILSGSRGQGGSSDISPSYILIFDQNGRLEYTLGETGSPDIPFNHIESMQTDSQGRLHVVARSFESWKYYVFSGNKRIHYYNLSKIDFIEKEDDKEYKGTLESVEPLYRGENLIISAAYYHDMRMQYRKVYEFSISEKKITRTLITLPDPRNVLFNVIDDKYLYFWNLDRDEIRFMIADMNGTILNNLKLNNMPPKSFYSNTFVDRSGNFYTYRITRNGIQFIKWE